MAGDRKVGEDRQGFESEPLVGLYEIGPDDELDEADLAGIADLDAGRTVSNEAVIRWLKSWGTGNRLPRPKCGE
ncbi:CopG family transcriptional regulator [Sphingomonas cannabina]|uniref:CopG family transcriptional regulator n=1 Tax=Sphingomonas cannabina TaxID=2899123 RepID=UPI001F2DE93D|nr:CopG family transcriptional regulator [Sphingomonas cannabina]UIJ44691.1 CopG family transcriptional regulator [Sphingomonas cannabina]